MATSRGFLLVLLLAGAFTGAAWSAPPGDWRWQVEGGAVSQPDSDIDSGGEFGIDRYFVDLSTSRRYASGTRVGVSLGYGSSRYDFSGELAPGGDAPWDRIEEASLGASVFYPFDDRWTLYGIPSVRFNAESGASFGDGQTLGLLAGASYRFSDRLSIGPGFGVFGELEDDVSLFPILIVDWKINEQLSLETGRGFAASRGPGLQLRWRPTSAWQFALGARYEKRRFRLDDEGVAPDGVGEDSSVPLFALAEYRVSRHLAFSLIGGARVGGSLELLDRDGRRITESDTDPAPFFGATLRVRL